MPDMQNIETAVRKDEFFSFFPEPISDSENFRERLDLFNAHSETMQDIRKPVRGPRSKVENSKVITC